MNYQKAVALRYQPKKDGAPKLVAKGQGYLAFDLGINPLDMFMRNRIQLYKSKIPFTSNYLEQCILEGSSRIGWTDKCISRAPSGGPKKMGKSSLNPTRNKKYRSHQWSKIRAS